MRKHTSGKNRKNLRKHLGSLLLATAITVTGGAATIPNAIYAAPAENEATADVVEGSTASSEAKETGTQAKPDSENTEKSVTTDEVTKSAEAEGVEKSETTEVTAKSAEAESVEKSEATEVTAKFAEAENSTESEEPEKASDEASDGKNTADEPENVISNTVTGSFSLDADMLADSDTLFAGWAQKQFDAVTRGANAGVSNSGNTIRFRSMKAAFPDRKEKFYQSLKSQVAVIAKNGGSTYLPYYPVVTSVELEQGLTEDEVMSNEAVRKEGINTIHQVLNRLIAECPYELYWFNKSKEINYLITSEYDATTGVCEISYQSIMLPVSDDYCGDEDFTVSADKAKLVQEAIANAKELVNQVQATSLSDWQKLAVYKYYICSSVAYADPPATYEGYGNPWQLIYVFDGDEKTTVMSDGYAKAFTYLCQLTTFEDSNAEVRTATGVVGNDVSSAERHAWNIVYLNGMNYLVDLTYIDALGNDTLFMRYPYDGLDGLDMFYSQNEGFSLLISGLKKPLLYVYDDETSSVYTDAERTFGVQFAGIEKGIQVKENPIYGDAWNDIVTVDPSAMTATIAGQTIAGTYRVQDGSVIPSANSETDWMVVFDSDDGKFNNMFVAAGSVTIAKRPVSIGWSNTTLTYNGSAQNPTATVSNKAQASDEVNVTVSGAQKAAGTYTATAAELTGAAADNYTLTGGTNLTASFTISEVKEPEATITVDETQQDQAAPKMSVTIPSALPEYVKENLLNEEQKAELADGNNLEIVPTIKALETAPTIDGEKITELAKQTGDFTGIKYLDIALLLRKEGAAEGTLISDTGNNQISITLNLNDYLPAVAQGYERKSVKVFAYHSGDAVAVDAGGTYDSKTGTYTFKTTRFSTYAVAYEDVKKTVTPLKPQSVKGAKLGARKANGTPNTGDDFDMALWLFPMMLALAGLMGIVIYRKGKARS